MKLNKIFKLLWLLYSSKGGWPEHFAIDGWSANHFPKGPVLVLRRDLNDFPNKLLVVVIIVIVMIIMIVTSVIEGKVDM